MESKVGSAPNGTFLAGSGWGSNGVVLEFGSETNGVGLLKGHSWKIGWKREGLLM